MDYQDVLVRQYKAYLETKDKFIDRSFFINRFYLLIVFGLLIYLFWQLDHLVISDYVPLSLIITAALGMASSMFWVLNQDAYAYLIKIKLGTVVEKLEQCLPVQAHHMEYEELKERTKKQKIMFVDLQKGVAFMCFLIFFAIFTYAAGVRIAQMIN